MRTYDPEDRQKIIDLLRSDSKDLKEAAQVLANAEGDRGDLLEAVAAEWIVDDGTGGAPFEVMYRISTRASDIDALAGFAGNILYPAQR